MKRDVIIDGFVQLGKVMTAIGNEQEWSGFELGITPDEYSKLAGLTGKQKLFNGWFTKENVLQSMRALGTQLTKVQLENWTANYTFSDSPKRVAVIMAGNIPLVGFHDFLCVLLSGNTAVCKLSSDDKTLLPALAEILVGFVPDLKERIEFSTGKINNIEAVIATGSDNSLKYFEQYFGKYPHIFRRNRTSVAVIDGSESKEDFEQLGHDIFDYFGLGCRNVSHLLIPENFDLNRFFEGVISYFPMINHHKYANNYDYNKAVYLLNQLPLLDNNFVLLRESNELFSPLAMVHYQFYSNQQEVDDFLNAHQDQIQAIIGKNYIPFGQAQCPMLNDYADGVDTMAFLNSL